MPFLPPNQQRQSTEGIQPMTAKQQKISSLPDISRHILGLTPTSCSRRIPSFHDAWKEEKLRFAEAALVFGDLCFIAGVPVAGL